MPSPCPICKNDSEITAPFEKIHPDTTDSLFRRIECPRCGIYCISTHILDYTLDSYKNISSRNRINLSSYLSANHKLYLHQHNIESLLRTTPANIESRAHAILFYLKGMSEFMGQDITLDTNDLRIHAKTWSMNSSEVIALLQYWQEKSLLSTLDIFDSTVDIQILPAGWDYLDKAEHLNHKSTQGFVAMWFDPTMDRTYTDAIYPAIKSAGYEPKRVDQHEHNNDITDEIIALIRRSKFIVADYTGHRGGVYYEAGFARGLGIEVFMTCRKDHMKDLHFDVNHRICIEWTEDNLADLQNKLTAKIEATLGRGPLIHDTK